MNSSNTVSSFLRILLVFFVYSVAVQVLDPVVPSLYARVAIALALTLLAVVLLDAIPAVRRGQTPTFEEGSVLYSARGFLLVVTFVLLAAVLASWLRTSVASPEWVLTTIAALLAAIVVFGSLVAYYWRTSPRSTRSDI